MKRAARWGGSLLGLSVTICLITLVALPVLAQEEEGSTTTTATTATTIQIVPAVPVEPPTATPATADWTYRFLIPTGLVLAAVVVLITSIRYFTNVVRQRYRIVEE